MLTGAPNVDNTSHGTAEKAGVLFEFLSSNCLLQLNSINKKPAGNVLDLCIVNDCEKVDASVVPTVVWHDPFVATVKLPFQIKPAYYHLSFDFKQGNYLCLYHHFANIDWSPVITNTDVNSACDAFTDLVTDGIQRFIPLETSKRQKFPWWFSSELKRTMKEKSRFHRHYKHGHGDAWYAKFSRARAEVKFFYRRHKEN